MGERGLAIRYEAGAATATDRVPVVPRFDFFIARAEDGSLRALLATDPVSGCSLLPGEWLTPPLPEPLADRCYGSRYDLGGRHISGPVDRDLLRLPVRVEDDCVFVAADLNLLTDGNGAALPRLTAPAAQIAALDTADLAPLEVRSYVLLEGGGVARYAVDGSVPPSVEAQRAMPRLPRFAFHVVRTAAGEIIALRATSAHRGCAAEWRNYSFEGSLEFFREGCGGSVFDTEGRWVFGPAPRDLDRLPVEVRESSVWITVGDAAVVEPVPVPVPQWIPAPADEGKAC